MWRAALAAGRQKGKRRRPRRASRWQSPRGHMGTTKPREMCGCSVGWLVGWLGERVIGRVRQCLVGWFGDGFVPSGGLPSIHPPATGRGRPRRAHIKYSAPPHPWSLSRLDGPGYRVAMGNKHIPQHVLLAWAYERRPRPPRPRLRSRSRSQSSQWSMDAPTLRFGPPATPAPSSPPSTELVLFPGSPLAHVDP